jgi:hypothetical protein
LNRRDYKDIREMVQPSQFVQTGKEGNDTGAVVQCLPSYNLSGEPQERALDCYHVADTHQTFRGFATVSDVDVQVFHRVSLLALTLFLQMRRFRADDPQDGATAMDYDFLSGQDARVDTAYAGAAEEPFVFYPSDHQPDLIHVSGKHHAWARLVAMSVLPADEVPDTVRADFGSQQREVPRDRLADSGLVAGDPR